MITVKQNVPSVFDNTSPLSRRTSILFNGEEKAFVNYREGRFEACWFDESDVKTSGVLERSTSFIAAVEVATDYVKATCLSALAWQLDVCVTRNENGRYEAIDASGRGIANACCPEKVFDDLVKHAASKDGYKEVSR